VSSFPDLQAVLGDVEAELERGDPNAALALLQPVAHAIASEDGAGFRELVNRLPVEIWHRDPLIAAALGQSYRAPDAPRGSAGLAYFAAARDSISAAPGTPAHCVAAVLVGHAGALRDNRRFAQARAVLAEAGAVIDRGLDGPLPAVMEVRARHALERGILDLHAGALLAAREQLLTAQGLAHSHLGRAEAVECTGALALVDFAIGDLDNADRHARESWSIAHGSALERSGFAAPAIMVRLLLAIDRGRFDQADGREATLLGAAVATEWEPYAALVAGALRAVHGRAAEALDLLSDARRGFLAGDGAPFGRDYTELVRAAQLSALGRGDEAWEILARLPSYERHLLCPGPHLASQLLIGGDLHGADAALAACESLGDLHVQRGLLEVRILRGAVSAGLGDQATSDLNVDLAFIGMARSGSRVPLRVLPEGTLSHLVESALGREHTPEVRALLEEVHLATAGAENRIDPLSRRERLVLAEAERGATVAAIAAALFISPNTVKTHLRRLYRKLGVSTREEAIRRARTLGLHEFTRDSPVPGRGSGRGTYG
jgi:DNA-binding CsgD family transcriptional regulator